MTVEPEAVLLCQIPGLNAGLVRRFLEHWSSASEILRAPSAELRAIGVSPAVIARIVAAPRQLAATTTGLKSLERMGIQSVPYLAPSYPQRLRDLADPPLLLQAQGRWPPADPSVALQTGGADDPLADAVRFIAAGLSDLGIAILTGADDLAVAPAQNSVCVLGYGLLLARSRVGETVRNAVQEQRATLLSVVPINGQSTPASDALASTVRAVLCDGWLATTPPSVVPDLRPAAFHWSLVPAGPDPSRPVVMLKPDEGAIRQIARALGVHHTSTATVQQERLW